MMIFYQLKTKTMPKSLSSLGVITIRAMTAIRPATIPSFEVVLFCKDSISFGG
jgi:hypothetical protein